MKKLLLSLLILTATTTACFASSDDYKAQLNTLKAEKAAKMKVVNVQINTISKQIQNVTLDDTISEQEKTKKLNNYTVQIQRLEDQKNEIRAKYTHDKELLNN